MVRQDMYVPMNKLIMDKEKFWTFTSLNIPYHTIAQKGIVVWCEQNLEGRWTMLGGNKFGFEEPADAMLFKIQFGFGV